MAIITSEITPQDSLDSFAATLEVASLTRSRLAKRAILTEYLAGISRGALPLAVTYLCGRPFPRSDPRTLSAGGAALVGALRLVRPGIEDAEIDAAWMKWADPGDLTNELPTGVAPAASNLSLLEVSELFSALAATPGLSEKVTLLAGGLAGMSASGARAFVKVLTGETRTGIREAAVEEAVAAAFDVPLEDVRTANRHRADLGAVAADASAGKVVHGGFAYFTPVDPMLAQPAENAEEIILRIAAPVLIEDKYDGIRCQLHMAGGDVRLFSRDRKEITRQFPDVVEAFAATGGSYVLDGEIMVIEKGVIQSFARLQQRLNRVRPTAAVIQSNPAAMIVFDLLVLGDDSLLEMPLAQRRAALEALVLPGGQVLAMQFHAASEAEIDFLFHKAMARGNEGLMAKSAASTYHSGRRGSHWMKLKRPLDSLDCVIVGAEWGHGRRRSVLSDYTFAVRDTATGSLVTIGKAYGGLTDAEIEELTLRLKDLTVAEFGRYRTVRPEIVLEIAYNGIQVSTRHKSGYALRFPRIARIRTDKGPNDISTTEDAARIYAASLRTGITGSSGESTVP